MTEDFSSNGFPIKDVIPRKPSSGSKGLNAKFLQGIFKMKNPEKYKGKAAPVYRSSYELAFMKFCDSCELVVEWASESTVIPYYSPLDKKQHAYFIDNYVKLKTKNGIKKYLVEVKPYRFTQPPVFNPKRKKSSMLYEQATYIKNQAKWAAARKHATAYGMEFWIITEKDLGIPVK